MNRLEVNQNIKIAMIAGNGGSGGLVGYIKGLISANVVPENVEIRLFCGEDLANKIVDVAERIEIYPTTLANERGKEVVLNRCLSSSFIGLINEYNPDVVLFLNGYIRKGLEYYPTVMVLHNQLYIDSRQLWRQGVSWLTLTLLAFRHQVRKSMKSSDGVIFLSDASRSQAVDKIIFFNKSTVTYFGIEQENRIESIEPKPIHTPIEMICISAIYPYKNQIELVHGLSLLKQDNNEFRLHLVGIADPKTKKKLELLIKQYNMQENVIFHDWIKHEKIKEMIDAMDVFIYPSSIETTGYGLMEGMARGAAIASSDESCFKDVLGDGGVYFQPSDKYSIYEAIKKLITDDSLRFTCSGKAWEISKRYTWDKLAKDTYNFLSSFSNKR